MKPIFKVAALAAILIAVLGILIFYHPEKSSNPGVTPGGSDNPGNGSSEEAVLIKRTGAIAEISDSSMVILGNEGEFSLSLSKETKFSDDKGQDSNASFFFKGVSVEAEEKGGRALSVRALSFPPIIISSPSSGFISSGQISFVISGKAFAGNEKVYVSVKNRRTSLEYISSSFSVTDDGSRYGSFSVPVDLSSALDIMDGDALDTRFFLKDKDKKETDIFSAAFIYNGGLVSKIKIYFGKSKGSCANVYPIERIVSASRSATRAAIEELIKGPSEKEKAEGYFTNISPETRIRDLKSVSASGNTSVDFDNAILRPVGGCSLSFSKMQIEKSLKENPMVKGMVFTVNGESGLLK